MRKVCLVNNYNYQQFLPTCLASIEKQTQPFDRVVIVDDGSTDGSRNIIASYCERIPGWVSVFKENAGQLSCFHAALPLVEKDDLVTFLDSDDVYPLDYLQQLLDKIKKFKADFYFCDVVEFEEGRDAPVAAALVAGGTDFVMESSSTLTRRFWLWLGSPTSAIAMTGHLYRKIFPYPHEEDWVTRADDIAVYGSGLLGASKAYLGSLCVAYRVHGGNHYFGRMFSEGYELRRRHKLEKLFGWYCHQQHISLATDNDIVARESALVPDELRKRFNLPTTRHIERKQESRQKKRVFLWTGKKR